MVSSAETDFVSDFRHFTSHTFYFSKWATTDKWRGHVGTVCTNKKRPRPSLSPRPPARNMPLMNKVRMESTQTWLVLYLEMVLTGCGGWACKRLRMQVTHVLPLRKPWKAGNHRVTASPRNPSTRHAASDMRHERILICGMRCDF